MLTLIVLSVILITKTFKIVVTGLLGQVALLRSLERDVVTSEKH